MRRSIINWGLSLFFIAMTLTTADADITTSLAGRWNFDDGTAADVSGSGSNGTLQGGVTPTLGKVGAGAMSFDGVNDTIHLGNMFNLTTGNKSISVWVKTSSDTRQIAVSKSSGSKIFQFEILNRTTARFYLSDGVTTHNPQFPITLSDGLWHHLVWSVDRSKTIGQFFFDGVEKTCSGNCVANLKSLGDVNNAGNLYISGNPGSVWNGSMDDVRIYNRALSQGDITQLYALGTTDDTIDPINISPTDDESVTVLAGALNLTGQKNSSTSFWNFYGGGDAPEGAFMGWINYGGAAGESSLRGAIKLPQTLAPGRYYVFVKGIAYYAGMKMDVSLGGSTATVDLLNDDFNRYWTSAGVVDITSSSDTLSILLKSGIANTEQKFLIRGIYITKDPLEIVFKDDTVMDLTFPTVMDNSPAVKGNVFENSDFEVGTGHGWSLDYFRGVPVASLWDTTTSKYGKASLKLPLTGESSIYGDNRKSGDKTFLSRIYHLKPNKKYTVSLWVKTDLTFPLGVRMSLSNTFGMIEQFSPPSGFHAQHKISTVVTLVPGVWQRISVSGFAIKYPTSDYQFSLETNTHLSLNNSLWIDGIQLEEGDLTDYRPAQGVELGLITDRPGNIYFEDETNAALLTYNSTNQATTKEIVYEVYDYLNRKVKSGTQSVTIPAYTTERSTLNINPGKRGIFRIVFWVDGVDGTEEEVNFSVVPRPSTMGMDENSVMGIHPNYLNFQLEELQRLGIKWARALSPSAFFRWSVVEPVDDQFVWYDDQVRRAARYGITTLGTLSTNNYWPAWANDPITGFMKLDKWEEFVGQTVAHYSKLGVKYWEIWNEPNYTFPPAFYAQMMKRAADAIEANDPEAKIVGMGGAYKDQFFKDVIAEMERQYPNWDWKQHFDALTTHLYPIAQKFDSTERFSVFNTDFIQKYNIPVWNTEAGAWDIGFAKGMNSNFISFGKNLWGSADAGRYYTGSLLAPEFTVTNFLHSIGNSQTKYFYYDSRIYASSNYYQGHPTILEYDDTIRAKGIAYAIAGNFLYGAVALGPVSLDSTTFAYLFDKKGGVPVLALWTKDLSSKALTLPVSSSQMRVYDIMGNPLPFNDSTIPYGRTPIYIEGVGISISDFQDALKKASVSSRQDNIAPSVSISQAPRGTTAQDFLRIRWIAIDETSTPGSSLVDLSIPGSNPDILPINNTGVIYSYRLRGLSDAWSGWTAKTHHSYNLSAGTYTFEVKAKDQAGNISSVADRIFTIGAVPINIGSGDVSGDGKVTMYDAALVLRFTLGSNLTDAQKQKADMNADGKIDGADVVAIAKKGLGL